MSAPENTTNGGSGGCDINDKTKRDSSAADDGSTTVSDPSKRSKNTSLLQEVINPTIYSKYFVDMERSLNDDDGINNTFREEYATATPYKHGHLKDLFHPTFITKVKDEVKQQSKVKFKESDLFRVYQSIDLGNLSSALVPTTKGEGGSCATPNNEDELIKLIESIPNVMKLRDVLYSQEFKSFIEYIAGLPPSTLSMSNQVDCAFNCHAPGCHLLCHDDVIGTRKISYIIYLTEDNWILEQEGGALELYPRQHDDGDKNDDNGQLSPVPTKRVSPIFNSMAFFEVVPGVSYHSVQEVIGERPRLSLQGWYHASKPPDNMEQATLQQLKKVAAKPSATAAAEQSGGTGTTKKGDNEVEAPAEGVDTGNSGNESSVLSESDKEYLSKYIQDVYLTEESMNNIRQKFEEDSSVQLVNFLQTKWVPKQPPKDGKQQHCYDDSYYTNGTSSEWRLQGPAHKQRYLLYQDNPDQTDDCHIIGSLLHHVQTKLFESVQFQNYLCYITSLDPYTGIDSSSIRRFRPGLDYTVAHYGLLLPSDKSVLDATMCFVQDDAQDDKDLWQSGDVGGFECYIEADDGNNGKSSGAGGGDSGGGPADEYNEDDDTELLSISASNNTLSLVFRDPGTMRFVKYVSYSAPSSRYDICMEYNVPPGPPEDDEDDEENDDEEEVDVGF